MSAPSLDSTDHHAVAPREALFPSFITSSSSLRCSLASLSPILPPVTIPVPVPPPIHHALRYFTNKCWECWRQFWTSWTRAAPPCSPQPPPPLCGVSPLPPFVMAYDFAASPLILQHFCHFTKPPPPPPSPSALPFCTSSPPLSRTFFCIFIPISLPFVIISQLIFLTVSIPKRKWFLPPGGRFASTPQTPTDM